MKRKRLFSLAMAFILAVGLSPVMTLPAGAVNPANPNGVEKYLFRGFDIFSGHELRADNLTDPKILKAGANLVGQYGTNSSTETYVEVTTGRTIEDLAVDTLMSSSFSVGGGGGLLFKTSAKSKISTSVNTAYKSSYDSYFFQSTVNRKVGKAYINDMEHPDTISTIQKQLDPNFLSELLNAKDIEGLFKKYGTHVLTSYCVGGWAEFQISAFNEKHNISDTWKSKFELSASASILNANANASTELSTELSTASATEIDSYFASARIIGGEGGIPDWGNVASANTYNTWTGTVSPENCEILTDKNLVLTGIWELLPAGHGDRYYALMREYMRLAQEADMAFANEYIYNRKMVQEVANVVDDKPLSDYAVTGKIEIHTVQDFASIGAQGGLGTLDGGSQGETLIKGNFILMNDLDFANLSTKPEKFGLNRDGYVFAGNFDGNGKTIRNYSDSRTEFTDMPNGSTIYVGLFPRNRGTIKNLTIENANIRLDSSVPDRTMDDTRWRGGIITGYNAGTIENCHVRASKIVVYLRAIHRYKDCTFLAYAGGIAGETSGSGVIKNCSFVKSFDNNKTNDMFTAGILAISDTQKGSNGSKSVNSAWAGGIVGLSSGSGKIEDCYSDAHIRSYTDKDSGSSYSAAGTYWSFSGGIVGELYEKGRVTRCFSSGYAKADNTIYKGIASGGECVEGSIAGKNFGGTLSECFYKSGQTPVKSGSASGTVSVNTFRDNRIGNVLVVEGSCWELPPLSPYPVHKPFEAAPTFIIEYPDGKPEYTAGDILDKKKLTDSIKVHFTTNPNDEPTTDVTNAVKIWYDLGKSGDNAGSIQFMYYPSTGTTAYIGILPVSVKEPDLITAPPTGVKLNRSAVTVKAGDFTILTPIFTPSYANDAVAWSSGNEDVATVTERGEVYALAIGTAVITVTTEEGGYTAQCAVTVISANSSDEFIDYNTDEIIVFGSEAGFYINLTRETMILPEAPEELDEDLPAGYTIAAYSIDGGAKWKPAKDAFSAAKFPKLLNKDMTLHISDKPIDKATKKPAEGAQIVTFAKINKRAAAPKLVANYLIAADPTGETAGEWVLSEKGGTTAVKDKIEIRAANAAKKAVDESGFGKFRDGAGSGVAVKPLTGTKAEKSVYFIRTAPAQNGNVYTAASKPKKITVTSEQKKPNYKADAKKGIIKVKAGTYVSVDGGKPMLYTAKSEIPLAEGTYDLWMAATAKKAASVKQTITR